MINKQGLWFVTLFSLILVLGIYYVTTKNDSNLLSMATNATEEEKTSIETTDSSVLI